MKRLAGIATAYAVVAALVLAAPLSAADDVPPEVVPPETAPTETTVSPLPAQPEPPASEPVAPPVEPAPAVETVPSPPSSPEPAPPVEQQEEKAPVRVASAPRATAAADTSVTIRDFEFAPASVTVDVGDTVTWTNEGPTPHTATADDGSSFDTGLLEAGESRSHTFEQAGTFQYFCQPHPNMRGTVTVRAASQGGDGAGGGGDTSSGDAGTATDDTGSDDDSGAALPATGLDAGALALLGLMTLALGAWLRRRASAAG
jgi:LPXTG-motif cell wall-anchored protein